MGCGASSAKPAGGSAPGKRGHLLDLVLVLGGPYINAADFSRRLASEQGAVHLSVADLMRQEVCACAAAAVAAALTAAAAAALSLLSLPPLPLLPPPPPLLPQLLPPPLLLLRGLSRGTGRAASREWMRRAEPCAKILLRAAPVLAGRVADVGGRRDLRDSAARQDRAGARDRRHHQGGDRQAAGRQLSA